MKMEFRSFPVGNVQFRTDGDKLNFAGEAAVFNSLSEDLGGFKERIDPGAFAKTIKEANVRLLINHNPDKLLASSRGKSLRLQESDRALKVEADMAPVSYARDASILMERGDMQDMSFQFSVIKADWATEEGWDVRVLKEVRLFDVSVVTFPAYQATSAGVRSLVPQLANLTSLSREEFLGIFGEARSGKTLSRKNLDLVKAAIDALSSLAASAEPDDKETKSLTTAEERARRLALLRIA